ncbi:response regulator [Psychroflexus aestuariivivens]|uniref:response regulator n=1 Tax=Psychroflexus aestuariivivens TaxID=1795040 RepID=UPI000FD747C1|nr:response regulator [Psychroflexus aestuariivivens]
MKNLEVINVDDDKMVLFIHERMMKHSGFFESPKSFLDGQETLDYLLSAKTKDKQFVIFLDVNMPGIDGWDFLDLLSEHGLSESCHVFIVTSSIDAADKEKSETYDEVAGFVEKPISVDKLHELKTHPNLADFYKS